MRRTRRGEVGGFALRTAGLPVALAGADAAPPDHVVLRFRQPVPASSRATLMLSLGNGRDGVGMPVSVENSAWRLPAWPVCRRAGRAATAGRQPSSLSLREALPAG